MEKKKKERSVWPIYAIGFVWLGFSLLGLLRSLFWFLLCAAASVGVYALLRAILDGRTTEDASPQPASAAAGQSAAEKPAAPEPEQPRRPQPEKKPCSPALEAVLKQGSEAVEKIQYLNDRIPDEKMSAQIALIQSLTQRIFDYVEDHEDKLPKIRQFLSYYLPTTIKLLEHYVELQDQGIRTENIAEGMQKIEALLDKVIVAFQQQLDALFESDVVDITAEIQVMEQMMRSEGLAAECGPFEAAGAERE